jgi:hypothetical protein
VTRKSASKKSNILKGDLFMKNVTKRLLTFVLAFVVAVTALVPVTTEAAISYDKTKVLYRNSTSSTSYSSLYIYGLTSSQTIKKASVKSSKAAVASPYYVERRTDTYKTEYIEKGYTDYSYNSYYYYIGLLCKKAGTATITFNLTDSKNSSNNKSYTTKVTIYDYENPVTTATITGINSGNNLKSKTAKQNYVNFTNKSDVKNAQFKVTTKGNWKISSVTYYKSGESHYYSCDSSKTTSKTISLGTLKKNAYSTIYVTFYNTKTGGYLTVYYYIN